MTKLCTKVDIRKKLLKLARFCAKVPKINLNADEKMKILKNNFKLKLEIITFRLIVKLNKKEDVRVNIYFESISSQFFNWKTESRY